MSNHFDALETRDPAQREAALLAALPNQVAHAKASARAFAKSLQSVDAASVNSRVALAKLPVIRKHELLEQQQALTRYRYLWRLLSYCLWQSDAPYLCKPRHHL